MSLNEFCHCGHPKSYHWWRTDPYEIAGQCVRIYSLLDNCKCDAYMVDNLRSLEEYAVAKEVRTND